MRIRRSRVLFGAPAEAGWAMSRARPSGAGSDVYDRVARFYDLTTLPLELLVHRRLRQRLFGFVPDDVQLLEVGVGTGLNLPYYSPRLHATAVDLSPRMVEQARHRAEQLGLEVSFLEANVHVLPFEDGTFDRVISTFVFCDITDPVGGLRELARVCRPDGQILLLEHVRPEGRLAGWLADAFDPVLFRVLGIHVNRRTVANVRSAGIRILDVRVSAGIYRTIVGRPGCGTNGLVELSGQG
ncbi:MAG: class I SAM-dependent methyltransferase [Nannocystales bacterium]